MNRLVVVKNDKQFVHPAYYLMEMSKEDKTFTSRLKKHLDWTDEKILKLLNGEIQFTKEICNKVAKFFGSSVELWEELQIKFDTLKK